MPYCHLFNSSLFHLFTYSRIRFIHFQLSQLTTDGELYHEYCLNYSKAITYLEQLRKNEDFCQFEKVITCCFLCNLARLLYSCIVRNSIPNVVIVLIMFHIQCILITIVNMSHIFLAWACSGVSRTVGVIGYS